MLTSSIISASLLLSRLPMSRAASANLPGNRFPTTGIGALTTESVYWRDPNVDPSVTVPDYVDPLMTEVISIKGGEVTISTALGRFDYTFDLSSVVDTSIILNSTVYLISSPKERPHGP
jgi:hypothetical protein